MSANRRKKMGKSWQAILSAVPLLALIWGVVSFVQGRKPTLTIAPRFLLVESDELVDLFAPDRQSILLADLPFPKPQFIQNDLYTAAAKAFSSDAIDKLGRTIKSAVFLAVTNTNTEQADTLKFQSNPPTIAYRHLGMGETALLCIHLAYLDGTSRDVRVEQVTLLTADGSKAGADVGPPPTGGGLATVPKHPGIKLGYPPTKGS
jgi:hypothetical protein